MTLALNEMESSSSSFLISDSANIFEEAKIDLSSLEIFSSLNHETTAHSNFDSNNLENMSSYSSTICNLQSQFTNTNTRDLNYIAIEQNGFYMPKNFTNESNTINVSNLSTYEEVHFENSIYDKSLNCAMDFEDEENYSKYDENKCFQDFQTNFKNFSSNFDCENYFNITKSIPSTSNRLKLGFFSFFLFLI